MVAVVGVTDATKDVIENVTGTLGAESEGATAGELEEKVDEDDAKPNIVYSGA